MSIQSIESTIDSLESKIKTIKANPEIVRRPVEIIHTLALRILQEQEKLINLT